MFALTSLSYAGGYEPVPESPPTVREIFVPFADLQPLLENQTQRVLMSRKEYDDLMQQAKKSPPQTPSPVAAMITSADYEMTSDGQRVDIAGTLSIDILEEGIHAIPLDLGSVGLLAAKFDEKDARIGRARNQRLHLLVSGVGVHTLKLSLVAPLETTSAQQVLNLRLPRGPVGGWRLRVPGDVEIKAGASVVSRKVDKSTKTTQFELLSIAGQATIVMSLNSHVQRTEQAVAARCVIFDTVTEGFEKVRATATFVVLHKAVDRLRFVVPDGFEITDVTCPNLLRWEIVTENNRKVVVVRLREQTTDKVELSVAAMKVGGSLAPWKAPRFELLDVVSQVSLVGLLVEERLNVDSVEPKDLIPIDTAAIMPAVPNEFNAPAADSSRLRLVAAWYAPQSNYALSATIKSPPSSFSVNTTVQLTIGDNGCRAAVQFIVSPEQERFFDFDFTVPRGWEVDQDIERALPGIRIERFTPKDAAGHIHVHLPQGIAVGQAAAIAFHASYHPQGWQGDWTKQKVEFPGFAVLGSKRDDGQWTVLAEDDLVVRPDKLEKISPLIDSELGVQNGASTGQLSYRYAGPESRATLTVERTPPRLTARTFAFFQVKAEGVAVHDEIIFHVEDAKTRQVAIDLPLDTPEALSIKGLGGVEVKPAWSQIVGKSRRWNIPLAVSRRGEIHIAVDFQLNTKSTIAPAGNGTPAAPGAKPQAAGKGDENAFVLPMVAAEGVVYQSGVVAIEGGAELDVEVKTNAQRVDIGQLAAADYQPGRRLLGAYGFVDVPPPIAINVVRHPGFGLTPVIVESAELKTLLGAHGESQTQVNYHLRTKVSYLNVELPPGAELWSAALDGQPLKPQRDAQSLLIGLPPSAEGALRNMQLVYSSTADNLAQTSRVQMTAPKLLLPGQKSLAEAVPVIRTQWHVDLPAGFEAVDDASSLTTSGIRQPESAPLVVAGILYELSGGVGVGQISAVRESARRTTTRNNLKALSEEEKTPSQGMNAFVTGAPLPAKSSKSGGEAEYKMDLHALIIDGSAAAPPTDPNIRSNLGYAFSEKPTKNGGDAGDAEFGITNSARVLGLSRANNHALTEKSYLGLSGARSLHIDVQQATADQNQGLDFETLAADPTINITLDDRGRVTALAWAAGLAMFLFGMTQTCACARRKVGIVLGVGIVATLLPLLWYTATMQILCNALFYAATALVPYYLLASLVRMIARGVGCAWNCCCGPKTVVTNTTMAALMFVALSFAGTLRADPPEGTPVVVVNEPPVQPVPDDAILLPYEPDSKDGFKSAKQLFVPYSRYTELWNRAHPDKKLDIRPAPLPYALSNAQYKATLEDVAGGESLTVHGKMHIDVLADGFISIPLWIAGGVLAKAELDGHPAQLSVVRPEEISVSKGKPASNIADALVVLQISGTGGHDLDVEARLKVARQGGWHIVEGDVPAAPAGRVLLTVPKSPTEVRLNQPSDHRSLEIEKPHEVIETALGPAGELSLRWRPTVTEAQVDRSLSVDSVGLLDIQEDGLHAAWQLRIQFRHGQRDSFTLTVPENYLVEKVAGSNVRGWDRRFRDGKSTVDVSLLKAAKESEAFTLFLWRKGRVGGAELQNFSAPLVTVDDAAATNGHITLRRSPLMDVRTISADGLTRIDESSLPDLSAGPDTDETVLKSRPYESYRFAAVPFDLQLHAEPAVAQVSATLQTIVKVAEIEPRLQSRITYHIADRPVYAFRIVVPDDLTRPVLLAPGLCQWSIQNVDNRPGISQHVMTVYMAAGQTGDMQLEIDGVLKAPDKEKQMPLPRLELLDVSRQQGDIVIQTDPAYDLLIRDMVRCQETALDPASTWLDPNQRALARGAIHFSQPNPQATLRLVQRQPDVSCDSITNVRITDRAIEETILLNYTIQKAGIHEVSFLLPASMADARIAVKLLRQKTIEQVVVDKKAKDAEPMVRVRLELQDDVMNDLRVVIQNDRLLTSGTHTAPIPQFDDKTAQRSTAQQATVHRQFVTLEVASHDELVTDATTGLELLSRQQQQWQSLAQVLGNQIQQAYLVTAGAGRPLLTFHTVHHEEIATAGARIDLAQTTLVVDAQGSYRAMVELSLDNSSEQFLDVELPADAELWTVRVADQAVKPVKMPHAKDDRHVLVPVLKTAAGDLNYPVVFKYGGKLPQPGLTSAVQFPFIHNIKSYSAGQDIGIARSQLELYLPKKQKWFDFSGTVHPVQDAADMAAGRTALLNKQGQRLLEVANSKDAYAQARALNNLSFICSESEKTQNQLGRQNSGNANLANELRANYSMLQQAKEQLKKAESTASAGDTTVSDNRDKLENYYKSQSVVKAKGAINMAGANSYTGATNFSDGSNKGNGENAVTKTGAGTVTLSSSNTYSGGTTVSGGTLQLNTKLAPQSQFGIVGAATDSGWMYSAVPFTPQQQNVTGNVYANASVAGLSNNSTGFNSNWIARNGLANNDAAQPANAPAVTITVGAGVAAANGLPSLQRDAGGQTLPSSNYLKDDVQYYLPGQQVAVPPGVSISGSGTLSLGTPNNSVISGIPQRAPMTASGGVAPGAANTYSGAAPLFGSARDSGRAYGPVPAAPPAAAAAPPPSEPPVSPADQPAREKSMVEHQGQHVPGPEIVAATPQSLIPNPSHDEGRKELQAYQKKLAMANDGKEQSAGVDALLGPKLANMAGLDHSRSMTIVDEGLASGKQTNLASLDFELPRDGDVYRFATPRGEVELSARAVSNQFLGRLYALLAFAIALVALWCLVRWLPGLARAIAKSLWAMIALTVLAAILAICGIFPVACFLFILVAVVYGFICLVRLSMRPKCV